jgi:hypothetical protein
MQVWHEHLLSAEGVYFLFHDTLDFSQHTKTERHESVDACASRPDKISADQQLVADHIRICRRFAQRLTECM